MKNVFKRIGLVFLALFLFAYVGYQIFQVLYSNITVETVETYSVYDTVETEAIVIRPETYVKADVGDGHLFYTVDNGRRVASGGTVAQIYPGAEAAAIHQQLEVMDADIAAMESVETLANNNYTDLEAINQQIGAVTRQISVQAHGVNAAALRERHADLLTLLNKRQIIVGTAENFQERLDQMRADRAALMAQSGEHIGIVTAPAAGFFVDTVDGYENYFSTDENKIKQLTPEEIEKALQANPPETKGYIGKVVSGYTWYLACSVPGERAAVLQEGQRLHIRLPFVTNDDIETIVLAVNRAVGDKTAVILKCNVMSDELSAIRIQTAQLLIQEYSGLKLPDSALQFNDQNQSGAYVRIGTSVSFKKVIVLYHNEKDGYSVCKVITQGDEIGEDEHISDYLQLYDDVVVKGKNLYDGKVVRS